MNLLNLDVPPLSPMYCLANCGKRLTDPRSRELGYGPDCAERLGIVSPQPSRIARRDGGDCEGQGDLLEEDR